jgi:hypothetical protein
VVSLFEQYVGSEVDVILDDLHHGIHEVFKYTDTTQDLTCTARAVVRSGHHTITRGGRAGVEGEGLTNRTGSQRGDQENLGIDHSTLSGPETRWTSMGKSFRFGWVSDELL